MKFAHLAADFANAVSLQDHDAVKAQLAVALQANAGLAAKYQKAQAQMAILKSMRSARRNWKRVAAAGVLILAAYAGYDRLTAEPAAQREASDKGFRQMAGATAFMETPDSPPVVRVVAGVPYWVIVRRDQNQRHDDGDGQPTTVQCVHLFAAKADADAGVYLKPHPYALWGWGWFTWPERAVDCRTADARRAAK